MIKALIAKSLEKRNRSTASPGKLKACNHCFPSRRLTFAIGSLILCGHQGDPMNQPKWAQDGSFLVVRDLQQMVPEFDS